MFPLRSDRLRPVFRHVDLVLGADAFQRWLLCM